MYLWNELSAVADSQMEIEIVACSYRQIWRGPGSMRETELSITWSRPPYKTEINHHTTGSIFRRETRGQALHAQDINSH